MAKARVIVINEKDNVATALESLRRGAEVAVEIQDNMEKITLVSDIPLGHKFALREIKKGDSVIKYGEPIGQSLAQNRPGRTCPRPQRDQQAAIEKKAMEFQGYRRADGRAGTRNTVLVIPSVGCSQEAARSIAQGLKGVVYLPNIQGCGQMGEDRHTVKRTLTGFGLNPNVVRCIDRRARMRGTCRREYRRRNQAKRQAGRSVGDPGGRGN